ncbi:MAG TPA: pirin family protein [Bdellovibrionota bacterium]|nr:pirin family protein [Bdellovibrionota bacterium]
MIKIRKADERGHFDHGWLNTFHTFSFGDYYDPDQMGFRTLRVINEDYVQPSEGFPPHSHRDMEILTYILEGALEHKDSLGTGSVIRAGDVQRMTAGTGVTHSEFNPSSTELVHLFQIWILPDRKGLPPSYEQKNWTTERFAGKFALIASPDARDNSCTIHQDASVWLGRFTSGQQVKHTIAKGRSIWLQMLKGRAAIGDTNLSDSDALGLDNEISLSINFTQTSEVLLFDLS